MISFSRTFSRNFFSRRAPARLTAAAIDILTALWRKNTWR
jgi:hypothetical protein